MSDNKEPPQWGRLLIKAIYLDLAAWTIGALGATFIIVFVALAIPLLIKLLKVLGVAYNDYLVWVGI